MRQMRFDQGTALPSDAVVVDVGGGNSHVSKALAQAFPSFGITVQRRLEVVEVTVYKTSSPGNMSCQARSFWEQEPLVGADVYFL